MKITAFLPCRQGSQRVPRKNIKQFANVEHGLIEIKLQQLLSTNNVDSVVLSSNDKEVIKYANGLKNTKLRVHVREESLSSSLTSTDALVGHALDLIQDGHILWTHVTSPFCDARLYQSILDAYKKVLLDGFDSLMTVNEIQGFVWDKNGPINYDREQEKWPRTQTLSPFYEVNSAVFLSSVENYEQLQDRIGFKPYLYKMDKIEGFDIDWNDDFKLAEAIYLNNTSTV